LQKKIVIEREGTILVEKTKGQLFEREKTKRQIEGENKRRDKSIEKTKRPIDRENEETNRSTENGETIEGENEETNRSTGRKRRDSRGRKRREKTKGIGEGEGQLLAHTLTLLCVSSR